MVEKKEELVGESQIIDFDKFTQKVWCYNPNQNTDNDKADYAGVPKDWELVRETPIESALKAHEIIRLIRELSSRSGAVSEPRNGGEKVVDDYMEVLISDKYELARSLPVRVCYDEDGLVIITSVDLNLYAEGCTEYEARANFSEILTEQLEDLHALTREGKKLGRDLRIQLSILKRILRSL